MIGKCLTGSNVICNFHNPNTATGLIESFPVSYYKCIHHHQIDRFVFLLIFNFCCYYDFSLHFSLKRLILFLLMIKVVSLQDYLYANLGQLLNRLVFRDTSDRLGQIIVELGRAETYLVRCCRAQTGKEF